MSLAIRAADATLLDGTIGRWGRTARIRDVVCGVAAACVL